MEFRDAVKYLRTELGLTQMELANALHINFATVGRWENGRTLPTRSMTAMLLEYARSHEASARCMDSLTRSVKAVAKKKLGLAGYEPSASEEETSEQLRAVFDGMNGGVSVVVYDDSGEVRLAYANDRYFAVFGYTKEQFAAELKAPHDTLYPQDIEYAGEKIASVKKTRTPITFKYRIIKRDGTIAWVRCSSSVTAVEGLGETVLISVLTDITDTVNAEQQALVFGQRLEAIMGKMGDGISASITHDDGTVEYVFINDRFYEVLGFTKEQYHQEVKDPFSLIYSEDAQALRQEVLSLKTIGDAKTLQYRVVRRDGIIRWVSAQITLMRFADTDSPVQLSVYTDITSMVEANTHLAEQRDQITDTINSTPSGISVVELDKTDIAGTLRTTYYNDRFSLSLGTRERNTMNGSVKIRFSLCLMKTCRVC